MHTNITINTHRTTTTTTTTTTNSRAGASPTWAPSDNYGTV